MAKNKIMTLEQQNIECQNVWPDIHFRSAASDIYNYDETRLYFQALPKGTMCFQTEKLSGGKKEKQYLTVLLMANMDGSDKRKPLVIGKSVKSRCFRGVASLPITYKSNKNAWMTAAFFQNWVSDFDKCMQTKGRKVCLLIDNCSTHDIEKAHLKCVELVYLPAHNVIYSIFRPKNHQKFQALLSIENATESSVYD